MNNLDKTYTDLLKDILENGTQKGDRTGTGTISVFGRQIRHKMSDGFPLLTTKKMYMKGIITELIWFLRGDTNIKYLLDNDCHIWNGDAYKNYWNSIETSEYDGFGPTSIKLPTLTQEEFINKIKTDDKFANKWGDLGPVYGKQWRSWGGIDTDSFLNTDNIEDPLLGGRGLFFKEYEIDQIANLINDLKNNPDSRRLMVNAWNVGELDSMVLPPCHYGFQVYTRELSLEERKVIAKKVLPILNTFLGNQSEEGWIEQCEKLNIPTRAISLMWNQRSVDTFLGLPFNIASYGLLLEIIAKEVNMVPDELIGNLGDVHLYSNHVEQAMEQIGRYLRVDERVCMCYENPKLDLSRLQEGMSDEKFTKVCDEFEIPKRTREPYPLPTLNIKLHFNNEPSFVPEQWLIDDFEIIGYKAHPTIKAPLSN
jgi:thymidylate synthase